MAPKKRREKSTFFMAEKRRKSSGRKSLNTLALEEYETDTEILGFSPLDVIDDLINDVHDSACDIVDEVECNLSSSFPQHTEMFQEGFDQFLDKWAVALDKYCDKFELFALKNSFKLSPELRSIVKKDQQNQNHENDETELYSEQQKELDLQISELQKQIQKERQSNQSLELGLHQMNETVVPNLAEISSYLTQMPLPVDEIGKQTNELLSEFHKLSQIHQIIQREIQNLPAAPEEVPLDLESKFLTHTQESNVKSATALHTLTEAMME